MRVGATARPLCRCGTILVCSAQAAGNPSVSDWSAEQLVQAEAATRLRDRSFFEGQNRLERDPDLSVAAPLNSTVRHPWQRVGLPFLDWDAANRASRTPVVPAPACRSPLCRVWYDGPLCGVPVMQRVGGTPVVRSARSGQPDRVLRVVPTNARCGGRATRGAWFRPNARCAGVIRGWCGPRMLVAGERGDRVAEHGVAADRCARAIVGFLNKRIGARSRQLNTKPLARKLDHGISIVRCALNQ